MVLKGLKQLIRGLGTQIEDKVKQGLIGTYKNSSKRNLEIELLTNSVNIRLVN